jgi:sterol desaturase/sphingolipid hydroxylase (fatty acid hydroxylase superfamily)
MCYFGCTSQNRAPINTMPTLTRLGFFATTLVILVVMETISPMKHHSYQGRGLTNLTLASINVLLIRVLIFCTGFEATHISRELNFGLLHYLDVTPTVSLILSIIFLDLAIYCQHIAMHKIPVLWQLHKVHHADSHLDFSTGVRFHPIEALLSFCFKSILILSLGISSLAFLVFEILLSSSSLFNHANILLPPTVNKILRLFIVTPDMHRVHHTVKYSDQRHNFGFNLSLWDRIFSTYQQQTNETLIGIKNVQPSASKKLRTMLFFPFNKEVK